MRNGQQKRMRGRNNNRRSSNPLTRVYESNGPDVKVRGTAHHVAEKYQQLARDAQASGDPVAAENYFQHAEHYLRLIASLQGQFGPQPGFGRDEDGDDEEMDDVSALDAPQPFSRNEQPYQPREAREPREQREPRQPRENRNGYRRNRDEDGGDGAQPRENREFRGSRNRPERAEAGEDGYAPRAPRAPRGEAGEEGYAPRAARAPRAEAGEEGYVPRAPRAPRAEASEDSPRPARAARGGEEEQVIGLPSFITGGGMAKERPEREAAPEEAAENGDVADGRLGRRRRRYRTRADRPEGGEEGAEASGGESAEAQQPLFND